MSEVQVEWIHNAKNNDIDRYIFFLYRRLHY